MYDFDSIYMEGIAPSIDLAGCEAVRDDTDFYGGIMHKSLFERILKADVMIADLTIASSNVFYELGVRHAVRGGATILTASLPQNISFDLALMKVIPYECHDGALSIESGENFRQNLSNRITTAVGGNEAADSPLFMFFEGYPGVNLSPTTGGAEIFLSYAREDEKQVLDVYYQLEAHGFKPWMDRQNLKPGERWELGIETALRRADFILVFLSESSVQKRGFIRREILKAVDKSLEMLDTDIFIVPVRLDDCQVPKELAEFQWFDLFAENKINKLVEALNAGLKHRRKT